MPAGTVLALGNFDGVHLGHRAVFRAAIDQAQRLGAKAYALTFDPHPQTFFQREAGPFLLMDLEVRRGQILEAGMDGVITLDFTKELAAMTAEEFIEKVLVGSCRAKHIVVGHDFVFGKNRQGTFELLTERLKAHGIAVTEVPAQKDDGGEVISSSRIRKALEEGDAQKASALLGRPFGFAGAVEKGAQRGRLMDFPTANMRAPKDTIHPRYGVYAVWVRPVGEDLWWPAVANLGVRPTFDTDEEMFEFHILDFHGEFYGSEWEVSLVSFLREERKFASMDELKEQIVRDAARARELLKVEHDE